MDMHLLWNSVQSICYRFQWNEGIGILLGVNGEFKRTQ